LKHRLVEPLGVSFGYVFRNKDEADNACCRHHQGEDHSGLLPPQEVRKHRDSAYVTHHRFLGSLTVVAWCSLFMVLRLNPRQACPLAAAAMSGRRGSVCGRKPKAPF
jgi:hypothetical protein